MTRVIAYTYMADMHSPGDALQDWRAGRLAVNNDHPHALVLGSSLELNRDEHGLSYNLQDAEGNLIHAVFDTDERAV